MSKPSLRNVVLIVALGMQIHGCARSGLTLSAQHPIRDSVRCVEPENEGVDIYLINLGWHTGIAISQDSATTEITQLIAEIAQHRWVEFGWGDRDFYMSEEDSVWGAIRALFFSSGSVMHVVGFEQAPREFFDTHHVFRIRISPEGHAKLLSFLTDSVAKNEKGKAVRLAGGLYGSSSFYAAVADFSLNRTCNTWTAQALAAAGCPITTALRRASSLHAEVNSLPAL